MTTQFRGFLTFLVASATLAPAFAAAQAPLELVSVNRRGVTGDLASAGAVVSGNGRYVAFASNAINLRALNDRSPYRDVFVRDRVAGTTEKISVAADGGEGNGNSQPDQLSAPAISDDGCIVAFSSQASNLVDGDDNGYEDIFVRDRCAGVTSLVSRADGGGGASGDSTFARLSADGQFVVYQSTAPNIVPGDNNGRSDIFAYDRVAGSTIRVSLVDGMTAEADGDSVIPNISGDGSVVAFESVARNIAEGADGERQVYVHEIASGRTILVSRNAGGAAGGDQSFCPSLNQDGSIVAFKSDASNLVPGDSNGVADTFVRDRNADTITRISVDNFGNQAHSLSAHPSVSADGRFVTFPAFDDFFDPADGNHQADVYVYDRQAPEGARIRRVSVEPVIDFVQEFANGGVPESAPSISSNGRWIAFSTTASNYLPPTDDLNNALDVFITCNPLTEPCPPECLGNEQCSDGRVCNSDNSCVTVTPTATATNTNTATPTPTGTRTITATNTARTNTPTNTPGRPCDTAADCDPGEACVNHICVPIPCDDNFDCPPESMCENGMCVPYPCNVPGDCPPGLDCENHICVPRDCNTDADCPPASECNADHMCVPIRCDEDRDCPPGSQCDENDDICVPIPCTTDADCPDTAMCNPDGLCVPIPCTTDQDCPPGSTCTEDDICVPIPCDDPTDCPEPSMCTDGQCIPIPCTTDEDCPSGNECDEAEGFCVPDTGGGGGGGGGCSCEVDPSHNRPTGAETLAFLMPAALLWWRRRIV